MLGSRSTLIRKNFHHFFSFVLLSLYISHSLPLFPLLHHKILFVHSATVFRFVSCKSSSSLSTKLLCDGKYIFPKVFPSLSLPLSLIFFLSHTFSLFTGVWWKKIHCWLLLDSSKFFSLSFSSSCVRRPSMRITRNKSVRQCSTLFFFGRNEIEIFLLKRSDFLDDNFWVFCRWVSIRISFAFPSRLRDDLHQC